MSRLSRVTVILFAILISISFAYACASPVLRGPAHILPWDTFSAMAQEVVSASPTGGCKNDDQEREGMIARFQHGDDTYLMAVLAGEKRLDWLIVLIPKGQKQPTYIWYGSGNGDRITPAHAEPYDPARHSAICKILAPDRA